MRIDGRVLCGLWLVGAALPLGAAAEEGPRWDQAAIPAQRAGCEQRLDAAGVETLTLDSDFTVFMERSCPGHIRERALRHLWRLLPQTPVADNQAI